MYDLQLSSLICVKMNFARKIYVLGNWEYKASNLDSGFLQTQPTSSSFDIKTALSCALRSLPSLLLGLILKTKRRGRWGP